MLSAVTSALLARLTRVRRREPRPQEPADLGTAFGMEQWLDERDRDAAAPVPAVAPRPSGAWVPRRKAILPR